jgi:23S rRNA (pseudouridine1915-N3)-methyltransferase
MRIVVAAVGRLKQGPETELSERYRKRAAQTGRSLGLRDVEVIEIRESRAEDPGKRMLEDKPAVVFVIGGADGLSPSLRDKATLRIAFGATTWPHQLVRVMLLEQLYRATTILTGHPYHRA